MRSLFLSLTVISIIFSAPVVFSQEKTEKKSFFKVLLEKEHEIQQTIEALDKTKQFPRTVEGKKQLLEATKELHQMLREERMLQEDSRFCDINIANKHGLFSSEFVDEMKERKKGNNKKIGGLRKQITSQKALIGNIHAAINKALVDEALAK